MNHRMIAYFLSVILWIEAALLLLPLACALIYREDPWPFLFTMALLVAAGIPFGIKKPKNTRIYAKEGFVCVALSWLLMSAFGALPFVFSGVIPHFLDAFFETVSGFTTTGASILPAVEGLPYGILFWRSFTHLIGGMGILVFMLAILPTIDGDGRAVHLLRAEVPGPTKGKLVPKLRQTALILYAIYLFLTVLQTLLLWAVGLPFYDALVSSFATTGTGGFAVKNLSIAAYANPAAEWIITVFMVLCGTNFNLFYFLLIRNVRDVLKNEEVRVYLALYLLASVTVAINTASLFPGVGDCIRTAFFQVASIMSTTGFSTVNYDLWPAFSKAILLLVMLTGACAGSTAGGLKISRVVILFKSALREIRQVLRPKSVNVIRLDGEAVPDPVIRTSNSYLATYMLLFVGLFLAISLDGLNFETTFTGLLTCISNVGPGFSLVGPMGNFSVFSHFSKFILSFAMLFGRLEIFPMMILLAPSTWKRR